MFHLKPKPSPPWSAGLETLGQEVELLGDHQDPGKPGVQDRVGVLQELDRLEILVAAIDVRNPAAPRARIVEVEHRGDGIHAQSVEVIHLQPEQRVGDEEVFHLVPAVVEDQGAPVGMLALARVGVLVEMRAIEPGECVRILREVAGDPVEDHADAVGVALVDELHEVFGRAEARRRRVEVGDLIAPGRLVRMFRDRQQLDVGETERPDVGHQLRRQFAIGERAVVGAAHPRAEMDLVNGERLLPGIARASPLHPRGVAPSVNAFEPVHDARGGRRYLGVERVWIGLEKDVSVRRAQLELVEIALGDAGHEYLPDAGCPVALHLVNEAVPAVERTDDGDALGVRRPYREGDAGDRADLPRMGAQPFVDAVVITLAEQPLIFAPEGEVAKRVAVDRLPRQAVAVEHAQPVVGGRVGQARFEQPGVVDHPHLVDDLGLVCRQHLHRDGARHHRPDDDRICVCGLLRRQLGPVRTQHGERVVVPARDDTCDLPTGQRRRRRGLANEQPQAGKPVPVTREQICQKGRAGEIRSDRIDVISLEPECRVGKKDAADLSFREIEGRSGGRLAGALVELRAVEPGEIAERRRKIAARVPQ